MRQINDFYVNLKLFKAGLNILVWYSCWVEAAMIKWSRSHDHGLQTCYLDHMTMTAEVLTRSQDHDCRSVI